MNKCGVGLASFISKSLSKRKPSKAKTYLIYLAKMKLLLISISVVSLLILSKFISENFGTISEEQIADKLNLPLGTVKSRIFFTRKKLGKWLIEFVN